MDDEAKFLEGLHTSNEDLARLEPALSRRIDLRTMLATETNHLLQQLRDWADQDDWRPELLCIDLNEASGKGVAGTAYLTLMRADEQWAGLPVVLTSKTESTEDEEKKSDSDLIHDVYARGADGYVLGKEASRGFLRLLRQQMPAWRHQARNRVWRDLLDENHHALQNAQEIEQSKAALQKTLEGLQTRLGIDHAFVRQGPRHNCPAWVQVGGEWAKARPVHDLGEIPLMSQVLNAQGRVTNVKKITEEDCGPYKVLVGKAYMGCALLLHQQFLGVMTVVCDRPGSFGPLDETHFQHLTEQVAFVLGTQRMERRQQNLRDALLAFSEKLTSTRNEHEVCQALAEAAHKVLHEQLEWAKCTVRLVEPGYPLLRRYGRTGSVGEGADIPLRLLPGAKDSMFRKAVTTQQIIAAHTPAEFEQQNYLDNNKDAAGRRWWISRSAITVPLALDRPDSTSDRAERSALGAFNLECDQADYYRAEWVQPFLNSLALAATRQIIGLRGARFAQRTLSLAMASYSDLPEDLWPKVHRALFELLGHNLLIQLDPPPGWDGQSVDEPWVVRRVFTSDPSRFSNDVNLWNAHFGQGDWKKTFTKSSVGYFVGQPEAKPRFTAYEAEFVQATTLMDGEKEEANAVMPLWRSGREKQLNGVMLLSWFCPPVMDKHTFDEVLSSFANYCALLLQHSADRQSGSERLREAEGRAAIAFAAQQFEHVLNNRLAALQGTAEQGLTCNNLQDAQQVLQDIRQQLSRLDERAQKSTLYLNPPVFTDVRLDQVWAEVIEELAKKAARLKVTLQPWGICLGESRHETGEFPIVKSDANYIWNGLFVLVDNAIESLAEYQNQAARAVWVEADGLHTERPKLRVWDNGPGVARPDALFKWGESTKARGQGIALALARDRLKVADIVLTYMPQEPGRGACFQMAFEPPPIRGVANGN